MQSYCKESQIKIKEIKKNKKTKVPTLKWNRVSSTERFRRNNINRYRSRRPFTE